MIIAIWYNICSKWFIDIRISTCFFANFTINMSFNKTLNVRYHFMYSDWIVSNSYLLCNTIKRNFFVYGNIHVLNVHVE